ncbi:MAG TPA: co-chaperone DjlA, partial [Alcanivorax sp.]|nr:co-chaperone DjlA [Alcanivorax sp.]
MRSWGGKLIVGLLGMLIGGPIGLAIGVLIGHFLDRGVERVQSFNPFRPYRPGEREEVQEALFSAVFSIMGHLAKADGRVSEQEIGQAEAIMSRMQLNDEQRRRAQEAFRHGKDDDFPLDRTVAEFRQRIRRRRHLVVVFLELLLQTALADGELHAEEERILFRVAAVLGVPKASSGRFS